MDRDRFEELVAEAIDGLPQEFLDKLENVDVVVADYPTRAQLGRLGRGSTLLGLYEGVPHTRRSRGYNLVTPDRITIFQKPIEAVCRGGGDITAEVQRVVLHEIAHHFGLSDAQLRKIEARKYGRGRGVRARAPSGKDTDSGREAVNAMKQGDIEARLQAVERYCQESRDIEAIKRVKHKYWRCLDLKLMDELAECFSRNAVADYGPRIKLQGRDAILAFLREAMGRLSGVHHGHNAEIEITGPSTARGTWALYNYMVDREAGRAVRVGGFYYDEYVREDGDWKISSTREVNVFREIFDARQSLKQPE